MPPVLGGQKYGAVADDVVVAASAQAGDDGTPKVVEMIKKLKAENLISYGKLIGEKTAHFWTLLGNVCLQKDIKKEVKEKEGTARLLTAEKATQKNSAVEELPMNDVLTATMNAGNRLIL